MLVLGMFLNSFFNRLTVWFESRRVPPQVQQPPQMSQPATGNWYIRRPNQLFHQCCVSSNPISAAGIAQAAVVVPQPAMTATCHRTYRSLQTETGDFCMLTIRLTSTVFAPTNFYGRHRTGSGASLHGLDQNLPAALVCKSMLQVDSNPTAPLALNDIPGRVRAVLHPSHRAWACLRCAELQRTERLCLQPARRQEQRCNASPFLALPSLAAPSPTAPSL
jgi:hypothetical protein